MKRIVFFICATVLTSTPTHGAEDCSAISVNRKLGPLRQRVCLIDAVDSGSLPSGQEQRYRSLAQTNLAVGYDLTLNWDRYRPSPKSPHVIERMTDTADTAMQDGRFKEAYAMYEDIEMQLRGLPSAARKQNLHFRFYILHSMARALYGMGKFRDSLHVYSWLPPEYPNFRQVLFEKMWAAFRLGRIDIAIGALASQRSSYFGQFLEPESYLVWIYVLKKLCREQDIRLVQRLILQYESDLDLNRVQYSDWAKSDAIALSWLRLIEAAKGQDLTPRMRDEIERLTTLLRRRFAGEKKRLLSQLGKVEKFSHLALDAKAAAFPPTKKVGSYSGLLKSGFEMWPVDDAEDWRDEIGKHLFTGKSLCRK